jgi:hypothetical protein
MNHKVTPSLPIHSAHTAPTSHSITTVHKIVTSENLPPNSRPHKKETRLGAFNSPNGFPGKRNSLNSINSMIERFGIKNPMLPQLPMRRIRVNCSRDPRLNVVEKSIHCFCLNAILLQKLYHTT